MSSISALELQMSSGSAGTTFQTVERVQSASFGFNLEKAVVKVLGRFKPLDDQPLITFAPIQLNVSFVKSTKEIETNFGLVNSTGIGIVFAGTDGAVIDNYSSRNFKLLHAPVQSNNYTAETDIWSGVLTSYNISASVNEPARGSFSVEALDYTTPTNNAGRETQRYGTNLVIPQNVRLSGIDVSGVGLSGITLQSFDLSVNLSRQAAFRLGARLPARVITDINATITLRGFFEGNHPSFSGTTQFQCGNPYTGTFYVTLVPGCAGVEATTYQIRQPFLDSMQIGAQVGSFSSVDLQFSCPISVNSGEAISGSNLTIF